MYVASRGAPLVLYAPPAALALVVPGLDTDVDYAICVSAWNAQGESSRSLSVATSIPSLPFTFSATEAAVVVASQAALFGLALVARRVTGRDFPGLFFALLGL